MKKLLIFTGIIFLAVFELHAQQQEDHKTPDEEIIINKKYDDQGNLIEYDSTTIHRWSMDTTFHFGFSGDSLFYPWNFPGIDRFMKEFWNDSGPESPAFPRHPFSLHFRFSPFDGDKPNRLQDPPWLTDSLFRKDFPFRFDSLLFDFSPGPHPKSFHEFDDDFFDDFEQRLNKHLYRFRDKHYAFPELKDKEYLKEWEQLMEKHRLELEELRKKWEQKEQEKEKN
jgi:hypothetical protein